MWRSTTSAASCAALQVHQAEDRAGIGFLGHQDRKMVVAQDAGGRGAELARRALRGLEQVLEALERAVGLDPDHPGVEHLVDHRNEGVGAESSLALRIEDHSVQRRKVDEPDVVAVGLLARHLGPADLAARPALVQDQDLLAEVLLGDRRHDARRHVGAAAGRIGHHQLHRPGRKWLPPGRRRRDEQRDGQQPQLPHGSSSMSWFRHCGWFSARRASRSRPRRSARRARAA